MLACQRQIIVHRWHWIFHYRLAQPQQKNFYKWTYRFLSGVRLEISTSIFSIINLGVLSFCFGEPEGLPAVDEVCIFDGEGGATAFSTVAGVGAGGADIVTIRFFFRKGNTLFCSVFDSGHLRFCSVPQVQITCRQKKNTTLTLLLCCFFRLRIIYYYYIFITTTDYYYVFCCCFSTTFLYNVLLL